MERPGFETLSGNQDQQQIWRHATVLEPLWHCREPHPLPALVLCVQSTWQGACIVVCLDKPTHRVQLCGQCVSTPSHLEPPPEKEPSIVMLLEKFVFEPRIKMA
jgi:hypothetical protein